MVAFVPSSKKSKVAPRQHWSSMRGLLMHSRQLHQVLKASEQDEDNQPCVRLQSPQATTYGGGAIAQQPQAAPMAKPIVFRKTKREIQREREQLALQQQKQQHVATASPHIEQSHRQRVSQEQSAIMRKLGTFRFTLLLASCKLLTRNNSLPRGARTCRTHYLRQQGNGVGINRRCPPRRRLLF